MMAEQTIVSRTVPCTACKKSVHYSDPYDVPMYCTGCQPRNVVSPCCGLLAYVHYFKSSRPSDTEFTCPDCKEVFKREDML